MVIAYKAKHLQIILLSSGLPLGCWKALLPLGSNLKMQETYAVACAAPSKKGKSLLFDLVNVLQHCVK